MSISCLELNYFNSQRCIFVHQYACVYVCVRQPTGVLGSRVLFVWHWWKKLWVFCSTVIICYTMCVWERKGGREIYSRGSIQGYYIESAAFYSVLLCAGRAPLSGRTALQLWLCSFTPRWHNIQHTGVPHASSQTEKSRLIHTWTYCSNALTQTHEFKMGRGMDVDIKESYRFIYLWMSMGG